MRYARSDITSFVTPGCPGHSEGADPEFTGLSVDCPVCEPHLADDPLWSGSPETVPLTAEEQASADRQEKEAQQITAQFASSLAEAAKEQVAKQRQATPAKKPARKATAKPSSR